MKRVLVVDDALTVRRYHRELLTAAGFEVEEAENGVEALEKGLGAAFDLLLVDVNMPKMDGYRFLAEARRREELRATPAVMISTEAGPGDREKAFLAGANAYLVKPVRPEMLRSCAALLTGASTS